MAKVLICGGVGFVGRNLVKYLADNKLASKICVSDKVLPEVAGLNDAELAIFKSDLVIFKQSNLAKEASAAKVFEEDGGNWNIVINLAAATKYSQPVEVYKESIVEVAKTVSALAAKYKARFVHVSTAQVYDAGKDPSDEGGKIKPWTALAKASRDAEEAVKATAGLNYVIVRPAIIYGPGDASGITPRLITGAVYKKLGEKMELLWDKGLRINTVHVYDVVRALWFLTSKGDSGEIFNLADENDTNQGTINEHIETLFGIKTGFMGSLKSKVATTVSMKTVAEVANDKHLQPWSELCKEHKIVDSPLTPYLDEELLYNNSLSVNGKKITTLGFSYEHPKVTTALLKDVIVDFEKKKFFPPGLTN